MSTLSGRDFSDEGRSLEKLKGIVDFNFCEVFFSSEIHGSG